MNGKRARALRKDAKKAAGGLFPTKYGVKKGEEYTKYIKDANGKILHTYKVATIRVAGGTRYFYREIKKAVKYYAP